MTPVVSGIGWVDQNGPGCGRAAGSTAFAGFAGDGGRLPAVRRGDLFQAPYKDFGRMDAYSRLGLAGVALALKDGGLEAWAEKRPIGLIAATVYGCLQTDIAYYHTVVPNRGAQASPTLFTYTLPSSATGEISIHLALKGGAATLTGGETSGLAALAHAAGEIERGGACWALAGAADVLSPTSILALGGGDNAPPLAEAAAFYTLGPGPPTGKASLARIAGSALRFGPAAAERAARRALDVAGIGEEDLRARLSFSPGGPHPLVTASAGRCLSVLPLLGMGVHLQRLGAAGLPALVVAEDSAGSAAALCLARDHHG